VKRFLEKAKKEKCFPLPTQVKVLLCHALHENQLRYIIYACWFVIYNKNESDQKVTHSNAHKLMCVDMHLLLHGAPKNWFWTMEKSFKTSFLEQLWDTDFRDIDHIQKWLCHYVEHEQ